MFDINVDGGYQWGYTVIVYNLIYPFVVSDGEEVGVESRAN